MNKLQILENIVSDRQAFKTTVNIGGKNRKVLIDLFSAQAMLLVAKALNDKNQEKFLSWNWFSMQQFALSKVGA